MSWWGWALLVTVGVVFVGLVGLVGFMLGLTAIARSVWRSK